MKAISAQPRNSFAAESLHAQYSLRHYASLRVPLVPVLAVGAADHAWTGLRDDVLIVKVSGAGAPPRSAATDRPPRPLLAQPRSRRRSARKGGKACDGLCLSRVADPPLSAALGPTGATAQRYCYAEAPARQRHWRLACRGTGRATCG
jgi:hypothetical protein